jgi:hypothetical protein
LTSSPYTSYDSEKSGKKFVSVGEVDFTILDKEGETLKQPGQTDEVPSDTAVAESGVEQSDNDRPSAVTAEFDIKEIVTNSHSLPVTSTNCHSLPVTSTDSQSLPVKLTDSHSPVEKKIGAVEKTDAVKVEIGNKNMEKDQILEPNEKNARSKENITDESAAKIEENTSLDDTDVKEAETTPDLKKTSLTSDTTEDDGGNPPTSIPSVTRSGKLFSKTDESDPSTDEAPTDPKSQPTVKREISAEERQML